MRILQKVDELMALCDQLKERLNQASGTRCQLAEAAADKALN
jgi:type I restriction enzyme S subunit